MFLKELQLWKSKSHINNNFEVVNAGNPDHEALLLFLADINTKTVKNPKLIFRYNFSQDNLENFKKLLVAT